MKVSQFAFFEMLQLFYESQHGRLLRTGEKAAIDKALVMDGQVAAESFAKAVKKLGFPFDREKLRADTSAELLELVGIDPVKEFQHIPEKYYFEGTRIWLYERVLEWYQQDDSDPASTVYAIFGKAGVGKSVAPAELCRAAGALDVELGSSAGRTHSLDIFVAAMHIFDHKKLTTHNPAQVIRSLSFQLKVSVSGFVVKNRPSAEQTDLFVLFDQLIKNPACDAPVKEQQTG